MKKVLLTLAAIPMAVAASQASAQTYANANATTNVQTRIANLEARFNAGAQAGVFSQNEYNLLRNRLAELRNLEQQYSYNGLTTSERRTLQTRIRTVRDEMRSAGGNGWANRYGWNDRDLDAYGNAYGNATTRYDAYGRPIPNSQVLYDQYGRPVATTNGYDQYGRPVANNGYDQYGRPVANNGYYGQGGPYEPVYAPQSNQNTAGNVLGGVLGSVVGGGSGMGGILGSVLGGGNLGVGSVITSAIANVLRGGNNYGYRDTNNTYFRSDGQQVYEIDARTNTVVRIHPLR